MPFFPSVRTLPPLPTALRQWMEPPGTGPVGYEGPERLRRALVLQQYQLAAAGPVRQIVWIDALPRERQSAVEKLKAAASRLLPGGRILVAVPAVSPEERGLLAKLQVRLGFCLDSTDVAAWFVESALTPVTQGWPQGLRSWVLTACAPGLPISHLLPVDASQFSDILDMKAGGTS